jgi:hypothetical protein
MFPPVTVGRQEVRATKTLLCEGTNSHRAGGDGLVTLSAIGMTDRPRGPMTGRTRR